MHYLPDTEDEDSAAEIFWPEGYKQVIRENVPGAIGDQLRMKNRFRRVYQQGYSGKYSSHSQFLDRIADMVAVAAENGADDAFDDILDAFLEEDALPDLRKYACYAWPKAFTREIRRRLEKVVVDEYGQDNVYGFAYRVGYRNDFGGFDEYLRQVAQIVLTGAMNGANDMLESIYRCFRNLSPLPPARRRPRRLKM
jgi:hypothetical protein